MQQIEPKMKLTKSASDQNVYFTYVCLVQENKSYVSNSNREQDPCPTNIFCRDHELNQVIEDEPIQVERSKALHELRKTSYVDTRKCNQNECAQPSSTKDCVFSTLLDDEENEPNPNILRLTKMKWLTEEQEGSPDVSPHSLSPVVSESSSCSQSSDDLLGRQVSFGNKCLSTILRLDREHNMFGLSNIAIVGPGATKKQKKDDDKPVFPQTAIIQVCMNSRCCKNRSRTDLPASLKCASCRPCCGVVCGSSTCSVPCSDAPCPIIVPCKSQSRSRCIVDCCNGYGLKIGVKKKPVYDPEPAELTPKSSCVLTKPFAARTCHHFPQCIPPSSCFPYLMPCFWPARKSAPCSVPTRCFHNPPCPAGRKKNAPCTVAPACARCPKHGSCTAGGKKCPDPECPGMNKVMKKEIETRYGKTKPTK